MNAVPLSLHAPDDALPHNIEAEAALLGSILINGDITDAVSDIVGPDDFYVTVHGRIFRACAQIHASGGQVNPITLKPHLQGDEGLKEVGGTAYLVQISTVSASYIGWREFAEQIRDLSRRRKLITAMQDLISRSHQTSSDDSIASIMEDADSALTSILDGSLDEMAGVKQVSAEQAFKDMLAEYDQPENGVRCGVMPNLDKRLGPIRPHHLVIGAGRPGMGKTAWALSYSVGAARKGHGVLFVSLEMSRIDLMQRATADVLFDSSWQVPYDKIRDNRLEGQDRREVYRASQYFKDLPFNIIDAGSLTIGRLNMLVRRWKRRMEARGQKLELVVIDYLQLLRSDSKSRGVYEAVSEVSRGLKSIAKTYDVGVLALAQLSREVEKRADKRPMLSDLRDSGQIEQDADAVMFLYREEYYLQQIEPRPGTDDYARWEQALELVHGEIDFIIAKRRNGTGGTCKGEFHGAFQAVRGRA